MEFITLRHYNINWEEKDMNSQTGYKKDEIA